VSDHSPSLRDALAASWDAHGGDTASTDTGGSTQSAPTEGNTTPPSQTATEAAPAPSADGRTRDASGRFATSSASPAATTPAASDMPEGYDAAVWNMLSPEARAQTAAWAGKQRETVAERDARLKG